MRMIKILFFSILSVTTLLSQETALFERKFEGTNQIAERYYVLKSNKTIKHGSYVKYFQIPTYYSKAEKKQLDLEHFVAIKGNYKNGKRDGEWVEFNNQGKFRTKGSYANEKKIGVWQTAKENGQVIENYDFDNSKMLKPIIKVDVSYPAIARDNGIEGGKVKVSYKINADCSVSDIVVLQALSSEFSSVVVNVLKRKSELQMRYGETCEAKADVYEINFRLE
jgi:hypothetical protein